MQWAEWQQSTFHWFRALIEQFSRLPELVGAGIERGQWLEPLVLLGLIVSAWLLQRLLRNRGGRWVQSIAQWAPAGPTAWRPLRRMFAILAVIGIQAAKTVLVVLWISALLIILPLTGDVWPVIGQRFLEAFVVIELARLLLNALLEPRAGGVRLAAVDNSTAAHWEGRLSSLIRWLGYGWLLVVPAVAIAGEALAELLALLVLIIALGLVYKLLVDIRRPIRDWLDGLARRSQGPLARALLRLLAPLWHWAAAAYVALLALTGVFSSDVQLAHIGRASALTLAILLLGGFLGHWLAVFSRTGIELPAGMRVRLPMLQTRLQAWVPRILRIIHGLLALAVIGFVLDAWRVWDLMQWLASPLGQQITGGVLALLGIGLVALIIWLVAVSWIEDRLNPETGHGEPAAREKTLLALFRNAVAIVIITLAAMIALSEIGVDIGPLLAGAGVIGLAVGFGAQKLVQDIITGVFIQLEDAIHQDDYVTAGGISGKVERLSIRSVGLRDLTGTLHIIPFSSVDTVSNFTRDFGYHLAEYGVAYRENIGEVIEQLHQAYAKLCADEAIADSVTGPLEVDGVSALADSSVNLRVRIRTVAGMHWAVGRAYNRYVKEVFDEAGIEIPFPHMTLYFGEDKSGSAPPAHVMLSKPADAS